MKFILKYYSILLFILFLSGCSSAVKPIHIKTEAIESVDVVLPHNRILKTPIIDVKQLKYDVFLSVLKKLNNVNNYSYNCEINKEDIKDWNNLNEISKNNISLLRYNGKDFKILRAVSEETIPSEEYSLTNAGEDLSTPFIYLEVEYTDKSSGIINAVYKNNKIHYLIYTETLAIDRDDREKTPHSLFTKILYYPSGNVKSYVTTSSFYDFKIGMDCQYSEDGAIIKEMNIEKSYFSNLNDIANVIYILDGNKNDYKPTPLLAWNQFFNNIFNYQRYLDTNYGKVWIVNKRDDVLLIDDVTRNIIEKNNFIELSDKEYFQKYGNKDFKEVEKELNTKILIIKVLECP